MQTPFSRLGAVRCLFFKSEQYQLIEMPVQVGASVDKRGHFTQAHTRIQKVRIEKPAQPDLFGNSEEPQKDKHSARLDVFINKHGGLGNLAHLMAGMTDGQQQRIFEEMGRLGGKSVVEVAAMFDNVKPEPAPQADLFASPQKHVDEIDTSPKHVEKIPENEHIAPSHSDGIVVPHAIVEHITGRGKTLRGVVRTDLTHEEAKAIDEYTFKKDGGYFIREKHLGSTRRDEVPEMAPVVENQQKTVENANKEAKNEEKQAPAAYDTPAVSHLPFGVQAGISKQARRDLNAQAAAIVARGGPFPEADKAILRQYSGNGGCGDSLNEFYTLPEVASAMWSVAQRLGVNGDVLEPSCGPGVFLHTAPTGSKVTGVEMDEISAKIAKALHGDRHEVANASLERFATQDERQYDGVLGNVPFGLRGSLIKDDKPGLKTADAYFCDTSMDKCKAGGIVGLIVPTGVMDSRTNRKLREAMLRKGQFLGAQRMPNTAFEHSHTEVTTDVIWFRKFPDDVAGALSSKSVSQDHLKELGLWDDEFLSGDYFTGRGAENVLGKMGAGWRAKAGMGADITVEGSMKGVPEAIAEFQPEEEKAIPAVTAILDAVGTDEKTRAVVLGGAMNRPYADKSKVGDTKTVDGIAYVLQGKPPRWHSIDEVLQSEALTQGQEIAGRIDALMAGMTAVNRPELEADLRAWVEAHGIPSKNKDVLLGAQQDKALYRLIGAVKSDGTLSDAVLGNVAQQQQGSFEATIRGLLNDHETVGVDELAKAAGVDSEEATDQLYGSPKYAIDPATGEWTTKDIYLTGDLWAKSDEVKAALAGEGLAPELRKKLEQQDMMLTEAIAPVSLEDAFIQVNSAFLPMTMLSAFLTARNRDSGNKYQEDLAPVEVTFDEGVYAITGGNKWSHSDLDKYLNRTGLKKDDKHIIDDLNVAFKDWLCASPEYREIAENLYNRKFRGFQEREFSNEPMDIPGMNTEGLKDYQWGGLRWALNAGKGIVAADVGLGKTARALMLARVLKTTGQAKRPMIVVPKSVLANWVAECEKWFPGSSVLTIGGAGDGPAERKRKYHDLQQNDYDFILISEPSFTEIDLDPTTKGEMNSKDFWVQRGDKLGNAGDKRTNQIRTAWEQARAGQEFGADDRTDAVYFNELGVDAMIVDEFHHCFPAGTLVDGVPIESLKEGDLVKSFNHDTKQIELKQILAVAAMPSKPLARVTLSTGQQIVSTFDHRFFTNEFGYVEAQHLNGFCSVILNTTKTNEDCRDEGSLQGMCQLQSGVYAKQGAALEVEYREDRDVLLQQVLCVEVENGTAGSARLAANAGNAKEAERSVKTVQLVADTGIAVAEDESNSADGSTKPEWPTSARRKGTCGNDSTINACECSHVDDGIHSQDGNIQLSSALHNRHCESINENCNRGGREQPQQLCAQGVGSQEDGILRIARVESVEILQPGSDGEFERLCSSGLVYDIEVDGNHNFFAEGVLVHNCKNLCSIKSRFGEQPKFMGGGGLSMRALDFNLKARWLLDAQGGKNVYGLTATPTKNSPIEIYAMLSHVAPEALEKVGIRNSEEFIDRFARIEEGLYQNTQGAMEEGQIVAGFHNMDELRSIMTRYIHRQTAEEVGLQLPERQDMPHLIDMDDAQQAKYSELRDLAAESGGKDATGDNHIFSIMDKMNKAAMDMSMLDSSYDGTKSPKYVACASEIIKGMKDGGQIVFSDYVDSHEKMAAALVAAGIPRNQIGIINAQVAPTSEKRQKICDAFNAGKLKVVIGNTPTMGEGLNLQKGTSDIHHLDLPWEPASMQQRNGRGLRQGNTNKGVRIHNYLAKGSFDGYRLQAILAKKDWQDAVWNGGNEVENLNKAGNISREEMAIMLSADPDQARAKFEANTKGKEERLIAGKTMEASQRFGKFQELKRSYAALKSKDNQSAARLKAKMDKEYSSLKADKYFTAKQALDLDTPVIVAPSGAVLHAGAGIDITDDDKAARYVITAVNPRGQTVTIRQYGDEKQAKREVDVKELTGLKPFAYDEKAETEEISRKIAERPIELKNISDAMKLPPAVIAANHAAIQKQMWDGVKSYAISAQGNKVALVERATGNPVLAESYEVGGNSDKFSHETHDFMLPTAENKAKIRQAWMDAERDASFGTNYSTTGNRRNQKSVTTAARHYGSSTQTKNPWNDALNELHEDKKYYGYESDSPTIKAAKAELQSKQVERVRHAKTFPDALDAAAPSGVIMESQKGHGAWVKLPRKVIATLWAKARHEGVLGSLIGMQEPKKESHGYKSNKHSQYYSSSAGNRSVHSALLAMAAAGGYDDLIHAMTEAGLRHHPDGKHDEALQAISQGHAHKPNQVLAMQKLAGAAGMLDKKRGELGDGYGGLNVPYYGGSGRDQTVGDKLAEMLADSQLKEAA